MQVRISGDTGMQWTAHASLHGRCWQRCRRPVRRTSAALESLQVRLCRLLTLECFAGNPAVPPRAARQALKQVPPPTADAGGHIRAHGLLICRGRTRKRAAILTLTLTLNRTLSNPT